MIAVQNVVVSVVDDRSVNFDPDGPGAAEPRLVDLVPFATFPGVSAGLIDIEQPLPLDQVSSLEEMVVVLEEDGSRTPCIQN